MTVDWVAEARRLFLSERPEHFTNYRHCDECAEHDQTLLTAEIDTIGLEELGNPGWDPICFSSPEGRSYYMPAFVRLSLDTVDDAFYFEQFLFHLEGDGPGNDWLLSCNQEQRRFVADFIRHMISSYPERLEECLCADQALRVYEVWAEG